MASGSGWNLWVWLAGGGCGWNLCVASGCSCKEVYIYISSYYLSLLLLYLLFFAAASLLFVYFLNVFRSLYISCILYIIASVYL